MNDPVLDRHLENCKKLMILWRKFHDYLNDCIKGKEFTAQDEADFLKLKSQIAILHDSFIESVEGNKLSTAQGMIDVVERCILLRQVEKMNPAEIKKMEIEWHESYLLLNETIGFVQEEIDRMAKISRVSWESKKIADKVVSRTTRVLTNRAFHFSLAALGVLFAAIILPMMGVYNYDFMEKTPITNKVYVAARGLARQYFLKDLEFKQWEDYNMPKWRKPMPDAYMAQDIPASQKEGVKARFITRAYPGVEPLEMQTDMKNAAYNDAEKFNKDGDDVYLYFALFPKTVEARSLVQKYETWKTKFQGTAFETQEKVFRIGNVCNVFYIIYCANTDRIDPVVSTLDPK